VNVQSAINTSLFQNWAVEAGANAQQYASCFAAQTYQSEINSDQALGSSYGVSGTPSFYIIDPTGKTTQIVGAEPYAQFQSALNTALAG
jgi:predicted DsbA family dithiol-disulfide isomerase